MSTDLIIIPAWIIGAFILFFDFPRYNIPAQEIWSFYALRRSKRFALASVIFLIVAWILNYHILLLFCIAFTAFFIVVSVLLYGAIWLQKKQEQAERAKLDAKQLK